MKKLQITFFILFLTFFAKGQDIWFIYQEFSPLNPINKFENWEHNIVFNKSVTCYLTENERDNNNISEWQLEEYRLKYNNIPVEYAIIKVHFQNDQIKFINGEWFREECFEGMDVIPSITENIAFDKAKEYINAEQYIWENKDEYSYLELTEQEYLKNPPKGEVIICKNYMNPDNTKLSLAYKFEIYATTPLSRNYVYVDAHTGKIIHVNSIIKNIDGTAATRYSGTRTISTYYADGYYRLRDYDNFRGNGIETYNMQRGTNYTNTDFTNTINNWINLNNANKDDAALDAHWGAMMTYDYYKNIHGRNSYNNLGGKIISYVHYGNNYENAFWNGSVMTYGDGGSKFDALTCLDVVAHEITHGVTTYAANLVYQNESGALNESISDIFAVCVENYVGGKSFYDLWSIGEDITLQGSNLRYLWLPIVGGQPSVYLGPLWYTGSGDYGGVHTNSGVFNYWFFLLTNGGTGTNGTIPFSVSGIGLEKTEKLVYKCLTKYFTPNTNYLAACLLTISAAFELFGACSYEVKSIVDAWSAVGINVFVTYQDNLVLTQTIPSGTIVKYGAISTIQASNVIQTNANVTYRAGQQILLKPGFEVNPGAEFHAFIEPCIISKDLNGNSHMRDNSDFFQKNIIDNQHNQLSQSVIYYPNPTNDMVHLSFVEKSSDIYLSVYDIIGKELFRKTITNNFFDVDLSPFSPGIFLFKITSDEYNQTIKIIKQ